MYRTLPSLSRRRTPCVVSVTRTVNSWSPSRSMSLARTPGVSMSSRFSYGVVYASFVPTGGTFRTPRRRGPLAVALGMSMTRSARPASPAPRTDRTTLAMQGRVPLSTGRSVESGGSEGPSPSANGPAGGQRPAQCPDAPPRRRTRSGGGEGGIRTHEVFRLSAFQVHVRAFVVRPFDDQFSSTELSVIGSAMRRRIRRRCCQNCCQSSQNQHKSPSLTKHINNLYPTNPQSNYLHLYRNLVPTITTNFNPHLTLSNSISNLTFNFPQ